MINLKALLYQDISRKDLTDWEKVKRRWGNKLKKTPKNSEILTEYYNLLKRGEIKKNSKLEDSLRIRKIRTLSGVAPFAIMMKPWPCPGKCVYCPQEKNMPKSYLSEEPAAARAKKLNFDPKKQFISRLQQLTNIGHRPEKLQIIIIGATFSAYPDKYKEKFVKAIYDAANSKISSTLEESQILNESAKYRIVGISVETRPDFISDKEIKLLRRLGVTKIQLGVQALCDNILKKIDRGHNTARIADATKMLRLAGFKICYHFMPNLPGSNPKKDLEMVKMMFDDPRFKPDTIKIYPCIVIPKTKLYSLYKKKKYKSYSDRQLGSLLIKIKLAVPKYCRIDRLVRDIPKKWTASGTIKTNMRQIVNIEMKKRGIKCRCVRCREVGDKKLTVFNLQFSIYKYKTRGGEEFFLSYESKQRLLALLRLQFPANNRSIFPALKNAAIIRELQVFGEQIPISKNSYNAVQHQGLGKKLIKKAEELAKKTGYKKLAVISGVGVRGYYRKLGYKLKSSYMIKYL